MQLVAYGAQDIYLTGNPMITYFKVVYRRHTNFAMESIAQTFNGTVGFNNKVTALISRNGDLVSGLTLEVVLPHLTDGGSADTRWIDSLGHYLIDEVSVEIGGQQIDKHYGDWLEIWAQLTLTEGKYADYYEMIGNDTADRGLTKVAAAGAVVGPGINLDANGQRVLYVPLQFWFCRNVGLALPLIALQYHEVKVNIKFRPSADVQIGAGLAAAGTLAATLWADYIYLDTDERRRFAQVSHEYLIEQLQKEDFTYTSTTVSAKLNFNHPVKELVWVGRRAAATDAKQWVNYTTVNATTGQAHVRGGMTDAAAPTGTSTAAMDVYRDSLAENLVQSGKLKLNGHDRFAVREGVYFNRMQPIDRHTRAPTSPGINVYSFALKPEDHQPSGTCNFSRIDNAELVLTLNSNAATGVIKVFAVNYNVLRIMSGMGGLAYSN